MLYKIAHQFPDDMIFEDGELFISLYQPTHRHFPQNKQDTIVFKNLLRQIEGLLKKQADKEFINLIMKPLYELEKDTDFWNNTLAGIAVLASQNKCIIYNLYNPVEEFAVVANSFHIKPLIQAFQPTENYQLLGLSRNDFALYQGDKFGFFKIEMDPNLPVTLEDVLGKQLTESYLSERSTGGGGENTRYHSQQDKNEEADKDTEKYFRYVDRFVYENYSKPSKLPLILVSLKEHHSHFKEISHNPYLIDEGINISYESLEMDKLKSKALEIIKPIALKKTQELIESFRNAEADSLGSSDLVQVVKAAYESRIKTLLLEEDRIIPGKIDYNTGKINFCDLKMPDCDDILDDLAQLVLKNKGNVQVLHKDKMPSLTGIAAIYRYN